MDAKGNPMTERFHFDVGCQCKTLMDTENNGRSAALCNNPKH